MYRDLAIQCMVPPLEEGVLGFGVEGIEFIQSASCLERSFSVRGQGPGSGGFEATA